MGSIFGVVDGNWRIIWGIEGLKVKKVENETVFIVMEKLILLVGWVVACGPLDGQIKEVGKSNDDNEMDQSRSTHINKCAINP